MTRSERRQYMLRLIFENETSQAAAALDGSLASREGGRASARRAARAAGPPGTVMELARPGRLLLSGPQPPAEAAAAARGVGSYPRRPLPTGAGAVFVAQGARVGERRKGAAHTQPPPQQALDSQSVGVVASSVRLAPRMPELRHEPGAADGLWHDAGDAPTRASTPEIGSD
jgi:hypothetical protein